MGYLRGITLFFRHLVSIRDEQKDVITLYTKYS